MELLITYRSIKPFTQLQKVTLKVNIKGFPCGLIVYMAFLQITECAALTH